MSHPFKSESARDKGERRKLAGMDAASWGKRRQKIETQVGLLDAILKSPDMTATSDKATGDLFAKFQDGGKWRGSAIRELAIDGLIRKVDAVLSIRSARHRGYVTKWQGIDRQQIANYLEVLRKALAEWPDEPPQEPPPDAPAVLCLIPTSPTNKPGAATAIATPGNSEAL